MKLLSRLLLLSVASAPLAAFSQVVCKAEQDALAAIDARYKPQYAAFTSRGEEIGKEKPGEGDQVKFNFKVDMKEQKWILHLPSVKTERNEIVMGVPQTTMKLQTWSYDVPRVRMERRKTGQYPEFTCKKDNWGIPYDCRTTWSNTYADVPVTDMVRTEVKLHVPEVALKDTKMAWDIPVLTWVENTWIVKVPEFTLINVAVEKGKDLQQKSDNLNRDIAAINASRKGDSRTVSRALYECFRKDIASQQATTEQQMDSSISSLTTSIDAIRAQGADPTKVPSSGNQALDLTKTLADLIQKRKSATDSFLTAIAQLDQAEKEALNALE